MVLRNVVIVVVLALAGYAGVSIAPRPADAATDLTGSWTFDWAGALGPSPIPCATAAVKQHGTDLYVYFTCPAGNVFSGTFNKGTGTFAVTTTILCKGFIETPFTLTGTASLDGNSMSGTWSTLCIYPISGTFSADRSGPATVTFSPPATSTATLTPTATCCGPEATLTPTQTQSPTPPPVGGVSLDASGRNAGGRVIPLVIALASCAAVGAAVWHAGRRA